MQRLRILPICLSALIFVVLIPLLGTAQIVPHPYNRNGEVGQPLQEQVARATGVFEGKAIESRSFWDAAHRTIYTVTTVQVYKVFKGKVASVVQVVMEGGVTPTGAVSLSHSGLSLDDRIVGVFFVAPFKDAALQPSVPDDQVYEVIHGNRGFFMYSGLPPQYNAADTPYLRYNNVEKSLYPLLSEYGNGPYKEYQEFDINLYNRVLERRGIDSQSYDWRSEKQKKNSTSQTGKSKSKAKCH